MAAAHFLTPMLTGAEGALSLVVPDRQVVLASSLTPAFDSASRRRGLLGRDGMAPGEGLVIAPSNAIHTFRMRFAIDVLFVARDGRILKLRDSMPANRMAAAWRGFAVIELPAGTLVGTGVGPGDRLEVRPAAVMPGATL